ncbi:metallophosphoesterase family protein [Variovorax ginsengisoli]|uniref:Phosphoesterase n=1 Tax=Variovorax ginsengisoli TaxID=363844 RepID=A0ABT8SFV8_9BURK|nr:metallophosphoesterase family protein [Variovorax ginsengisoli]MDN8618626.1 metallophosphoesterase family protein [Variovorax ginsengisoli]MDO1537796.1 metallophosphoesterase family protein [Variovorax ginsengisoli]
MRIGVISDTHGLLRPEALAFLQGSDRIVHGGDIGDPRILDALAAIAPLTVVRGNNDGAAWADGVPETALLEAGGLRLFAIHDLALLRIDPVADGIQVVVSGHSHRPLAEQRGPVLYLNPGSAGPRRFKLPISVAELRIEGDAITPRLVAL